MMGGRPLLAARCSSSSRGPSLTISATDHTFVLSMRRGIAIAARNAHTGTDYISPRRIVELNVPRRHEVPEKTELSKQNIQDRFFGNNDPVARKILAGHAEQQGLKPPEDESVVRPPGSISTFDDSCTQMSLFLSSLPASATEDTVRTRVVKSLPSVDPTSLRSVVHVAKSRCVPDSLTFLVSIHLKTATFRCAFVNFKDRISAERAAESWANGLDMDGERLGVRWGRSKSTPAATPAASAVTAA
jgi:pre-mRNA-splicing factor RBM22/SLT11